MNDNSPRRMLPSGLHGNATMDRKHVCPICNWPQEHRQRLHDDLSTPPEEIEPLSVLCDRHMISPIVLTAHIGICLGNAMLAYATSQKNVIHVQDVSRAMIEGISSSLTRSLELLQEVEESTDLSDASRLQLAKSYNDLAKTQTGVLNSLGAAQRDAETKDRLVMLEGRLANQSAQTKASSTKQIAGSGKRMADVVTLDMVNEPDVDPLS